LLLGFATSGASGHEGKSLVDWHWANLSASFMVPFWTLEVHRNSAGMEHKIERLPHRN